MAFFLEQTHVNVLFVLKLDLALDINYTRKFCDSLGIDGMYYNSFILALNTLVSVFLHVINFFHSIKFITIFIKLFITIE